MLLLMWFHLPFRFPPPPPPPPPRPAPREQANEVAAGYWTREESQDPAWTICEYSTDSVGPTCNLAVNHRCLKNALAFRHKMYNIIIYNVAVDHRGWSLERHVARTHRHWVKSRSALCCRRNAEVWSSLHTPLHVHGYNECVAEYIYVLMRSRSKIITSHRKW